MPDIPTTEPSEIVAGNTVKWMRNDLTDDYPASTWTLRYYLVQTGAQIVITATAIGDTFSVNVTKATTAGWSAGMYMWEAFVNDGNERFQIEHGVLEVKPDIAAQTSGYDARTHVKKVLDAIQATIENTATQEQKSMSIDGMGMEKRTPAELIVLFDRYNNMYTQEKKTERVRQGLGHKGKIFVRFNK